MRKRFLLILSIGCIVLVALSSAFVLLAHDWQPAHSSLVPTPFSQSTSQPIERATPPPVSSRPDFSTGVVFPQWGKAAYSATDLNWAKGLGEIQHLHARWVAMVLPLHMDSQTSTVIHTESDTPTPQSFQTGIVQAHSMGLHVFVYPLITLAGPQSWVGVVNFSDESQSAAWFASYWQVLKPYVQAMQREHADMFSVGNEYDGLESANPALWLGLIQHVRADYAGKVIYNRNWASFEKSLPSWVSALDTLGVSTYWSVTPTSLRLSQAQAVTLWKQNVQSHLDAITRQVGKPVVVTEIGYRNVPDAGYLPYVADRNGPQDDQEQAILYNAAMQNIASDQNISGVFWWAWSLPPWLPNNVASSQVLTRWFSAL
ncbi:MAG: hypothetical protein ABI413_17080 [Ktedonobacteraceae bacterium]